MVLYFFRVNEEHWRLTPQSALAVLKGVFHCTLVMVVLLYMMRGTVTVPSANGVTSAFPTMALLWTFIMGCILLMGWRAVAGLAAGRERLADEPQYTLLVTREPGVTQAPGMPSWLNTPGLRGCLVASASLDWREGQMLPSVAPGESAADEVCAVPAELSREETLGILGTAEHARRRAAFLPTELEWLLGTTSLSLISYIPVLAVERPPMHEVDAFCKRVMDVVAGAALLVSGLPGFLGMRHAGVQFTAVTRIGRGGQAFVLRRPVGGGVAWWRAGARRAGLGIALVRGDLALVGAPAMTARLYATMTPLERMFLVNRPGLWGPRGIRFRGMGRVRPCLHAVMLYARAAGLTFDMPYLVTGVRSLFAW